MLKKYVIFSALLLVLPALSQAQNVGKCGWGSKLMDGQGGIAPQVLAVTTNGTSGNQTFGITTGTSGCTQDGVIRSNWRTAMFIGSNMDKLAKDISAGRGETLETLAQLIGVGAAQEEEFFQTARANFDNIFPRVDVSSQEVISSLREVLRSHPDLAQFSNFS